MVSPAEEIVLDSTIPVRDCEAGKKYRWIIALAGR
jgi:hypothetical protein